MILRFAIGGFLALFLGANSFACSCGEWSGHVSDFTKDYISIWAVPTKASAIIDEIENRGGDVIYSLEILNGFDRILQTDLEVKSSVADGASCGIQLTVGLPQFINAYKYDTDKYAVSSCTPSLPYHALKAYLETGEDIYIPKWSECHSWPKASRNSGPVFNEDREDCAVWNDADYDNMYYGDEDLLIYRKIWWDKMDALKR